MWWKKNKWKVIVPLLVIAILAGAFWYGGGAPGMRGWKVDAKEADAVPVEAATNLQPENTASPEIKAVSMPEETVFPEKTLKPAETPTPTDAPEPTEKQSGAEEPGETFAPGTEEEKENDSGPQGMDIDPSTGKDKYLTDPVPAGRPVPVEPQDAVISDVAHTCTVSISCATILSNMDWLDPEKTELVPEDGWILKPITVTFYDGESVFNVLQRVCKQQKIHMEFENTPIYNSAYIEGIANLYEFDCGELSGWMYKVNDWFPNYGCSRYRLCDGDVICWVYTCDLGYDVGGGYATGG